MKVLKINKEHKEELKNKKVFISSFDLEDGSFIEAISIDHLDEYPHLEVVDVIDPEVFFLKQEEELLNKILQHES